MLNKKTLLYYFSCFHHTMLCSADYAVARCPSVTCQCAIETAKHIINSFSHSCSHIILVCPYQTARQYSDGVPERVHRIHRVLKIAVFLTNVSLYLQNDTRYLQLPTNSKSCRVYRTVPFSMSLNDPKPRFQGHTII